MSSRTSRRSSMESGMDAEGRRSQMESRTSRRSSMGYGSNMNSRSQPAEGPRKYVLVSPGRAAAAENEAEQAQHHQHHQHHRGTSVGMLLFWLILIFLIIFVLLALFQPVWVLNPEGLPDYGKMALAALIVSLIAVLIIWIVQAASRSRHSA